MSIPFNHSISKSLPINTCIARIRTTHATSYIVVLKFNKNQNKKAPSNKRPYIGADEGNRTLVFSLGSCCTAIVLHPQPFHCNNFVLKCQEFLRFNPITVYVFCWLYGGFWYSYHESLRMRLNQTEVKTLKLVLRWICYFFLLILTTVGIWELAHVSEGKIFSENGIIENAQCVLLLLACCLFGVLAWQRSDYRAVLLGFVSLCLLLKLPTCQPCLTQVKPRGWNQENTERERQRPENLV